MALRALHTELSFFLDANCVNARQFIGALNELERLRDAGAITLIYSRATHGEAGCGNKLRTAKAAKYSFMTVDPEWGDNPEVRLAIQNILHPNGVCTPNQRNDVEAVYYAERLRWPLVTTDGASKSQPQGILGCAAELLELGIEVIRPQDALERALALTERPAC